MVIRYEYPQFLGIGYFFGYQNLKMLGFWVWVEFWVATSNTLPKPKNFWVQLYEITKIQLLIIGNNLNHSIKVGFQYAALDFSNVT